MGRKPIAAIVGYGRTSFGEHWDKNFEDLLVEAGLRTLDSVDKGLDRDQIEACCFSSSLPQAISKTGLMEGYMSRELGLNIPMTMVGGGSASGSSALYEACRFVRTGKNIVLVGGIEKMTDRVKKIQDDLMFDADRYEFYTGFTPQCLAATMMARYIHEYGGNASEACREAFARIASKNHHHAVYNIYAQFRRDLPVERILSSGLVADPLRALECSPLSDGAAALILVNPEIAKSFTDTPIYIIASQKVTDNIDLGSRKYVSGIPSTEIAVRDALKEADMEMGDIDLAEVHDSYTPYELFFLEDSGFVGRGEAWKIINNTDLKVDSKHIPYTNGEGSELIVNAGGGLKADGNPLGATGIRQIYEIVSQLRGEAGDRQVDKSDLNVGLAHNMGGTGGICNIHILVRDL